MTTPTASGDPSEPSQWSPPGDPGVAAPATSGQSAWPGQGDWPAGHPAGPGPGGWPGGWQAPPAPPQGRNGLAVAALVLGIVPVFGGVLALIFGLVARSQTRRSGQRGTTMATVGACLGAAWLVVLGGLTVWAVTSEAERDDAGAVVAEGDESAFELAVGDCLSSLDDGVEVMSVPLVPCAEPHDGEVYDSFTLPEGDFPGDEDVATAADTGCTDRFEGFVGVPYEDSVLEIYFFSPTRRSWSLSNDRRVTCVIATDGATGSVRGSAN